MIAIIENSLKALASFDVFKKFLPSLRGAHLAAKKYKVRADFLEAEKKSLCAILKHTDIATLSVGKPTEEGIKPFSWQTLAKMAGIGLRRFFRVLIFLRKAGYISTQYIKGRYLVIKNVTPLLFFELGHKKKYFEGQKEWHENRRKKEEVKREAQVAERNLATLAAIVRNTPASSVFNPPVAAPEISCQKNSDNPGYEAWRSAMKVIFSNHKAKRS